MGFLDKLKDAADSAKDKLSNATGVDTDKAFDAAGSFTDAAENLNDAQDSWNEATHRQ
jgi:hypothetical protein